MLRDSFGGDDLDRPVNTSCHAHFGIIWPGPQFDAALPAMITAVSMLAAQVTLVSQGRFSAEVHAAVQRTNAADPSTWQIVLQEGAPGV